LAHPACDICRKTITISSSDFPELCIVCGNEFIETTRALAELTLEMANAYNINPLKESSKLPGVPIEEIQIRMNLNRIKDKRSDKFQQVASG
jgi:hypothetical protein